MSATSETGHRWPSGATDQRETSLGAVPIPRIVPYVQSADFEAARSFYVDFLGLEVSMSMPSFLGIVSPDNPKAQIVVSSAGAEQPMPSFGIDLGSPEAVEAAHKAAGDEGREVVYPLTDEPWGIRRFFVKDPGGAVVSVLAHLPDAA